MTVFAVDRINDVRPRYVIAAEHALTELTTSPGDPRSLAFCHDGLLTFSRHWSGSVRIG